MKVFLNEYNKAKDFNILAMKQEYEVFLRSGRYTVDGKSIMGIFSLNLSKPIEFIVDEEKLGDITLEEVKETFKDFIFNE